MSETASEVAGVGWKAVFKKRARVLEREEAEGSEEGWVGG